MATLCVKSALVLYLIVNLDVLKCAEMNKIRYGIKNLGGHIDVGQLYDASTDTRIPGEFLWYRNETKLINWPDNFQTKQSHGTSRNLLDRLDHLELDASLKVSFLVGLIEISGSANYLNHQREYKNSYRFTRQYYSEGKDVSIDTEMSVVNHNNCKSPGATHVVTAVKYGFNAFMMFEVEKSEDEKDHKIEGFLSVLVKNLPGFINEGHEVILNQWDETEKDVKDRMLFSYEGDVDIKLPETFEEARTRWNEIQNVARLNQRVISYTVSPLERFCNLEAGILTEITEGNIEKVGMMMQDFDETSLLLKSFEKRQFTLENEGYLLLIQNLIQRYNTERNKLEKKFRAILPRIRKGLAAEDELENLLVEYEKSPFKFTKIDRFLKTRETEIDLIQSITQKSDDLENVHKIVQGSGSFGSCFFGNTYVVIYDLDVLPPNPESFIQQYEEANGLLQENDKWKMPEELGKNKALLDGLTRLATINHNDATSICFIMRVNEYNSSAETNFRMKLLGTKSKVLLEEFKPPGEDDIFYRTNIIEHGLEHMKLKINHFNVSQLRPILKAEIIEPGIWQETRNFTMELKTMETIIMLNRLKPNTFYSVNYKVDLYEREHPAPFEPQCTAATGCIGSTGFKERYLSYFLTQPCSVPKELSCEATSENSIELTWKLPNFIAKGVTVDQFEYTLSQQKVGGRNNELISSDKTSERKVEFKNLSPASTYSFKIKYKGNDKTFELSDEKFVRLKIEGPDALISCSTLPSKLTGLKSLKVDPTKATDKQSN